MSKEEDYKPAAAQEAVAWFTDDHLSDKSATTYDASVAERWSAKGWPVTPLYAAPVAAAPGIDLAQFKDLIGFAAWNAINLPETDPRRDFIRQASELRALIDANPKGVTLRNDGSSEAQFIADSESLNCPACGGSGHIDDSHKDGSTDAQDTALNTLAVLFHNGEEVEGPDGMAVRVDLNLWHEASDAFDLLNGNFDAETLATSAEVGA